MAHRNNKNKKNNSKKGGNFNKQNSITAPYNFVPLNKEVFYPEWSNRFKKDKNGKKIHDFPVHDVPFRDGESGEIDIEILTHSPIFIRNHYQEGDDFYEVERKVKKIDEDGKIKNEKEKVKISTEFCYAKEEDGAKRFYIPATSIKGMIRNIVEIMGFSKIRIDEVEHKKSMSVRDMTNRAILVGTAKGCGFLEKTANGYALKDCGKVIVVSHEKLQNDANIYTKRFTTAKEKYNEYGEKTLFCSICEDRSGNFPKTKANILQSGQKFNLVFTGDIENKKHEFVFRDSNNNVTLKKGVFESFKKVYFENKDSVDGQYWKEEWSKNKKIPVFYTKNKKGEITAIGLTQLFKLSYKKTIFQASKQDIEAGKLDLAETIFGIEDNKIALKGRVYFSHLKSNIVRYEADKEVEQVLGSPNPSYYPNYIEQTKLRGKNVENYKTLMDEDATIRGYKRYPLQNQIQPYSLPTKDNGSVNHEVATKFKPLQKGTIFKGKLRFHNLKREEIGAILSALTFHGQNDKYYHNIGMAKPLGYGKIKITLKYNKTLRHTQEEYIKAFEDMMNAWDKKEFESWRNSRQMKELFAMSDKNEAKSLRYQRLDSKKKIDDFSKAKKAKKFLLPHSGDIQKAKENDNVIYSENNGIFNDSFSKLKEIK